MKFIENKELCIIGDTHGCYDEFIALLRMVGYDIVKNKIIHSPYQLILIGDYVDKGPQVRQMVEFLYENKDSILLIIGNHENFNYKYLSGQLKPSDDNSKLITNYFQSIRLFESDEELKKKFFELFAMSYHSIGNVFFVLTHAPCKIKYLFNEDSKSQRHQRTIVYPKSDIGEEDDILTIRDEFFTFLKEEEAVDFTHVFGHVMLSDIHNYKNRIGIDTGCVAGNKLTAMITKNENYFFASQQSFQTKKEKLYPLVKL